MAASRLRFVVVFVIITLIHFRLYYAEIERHSLNDVIVAASKVIKYCKQNYQTLSFDGHFGVRVMEGQLKLLLAEYEKGYHRTVPATVMTQLRQLAEEAAKVGNMAVPHLLDQDPRTFNMVRYQVQNPWTMFHSHRMTDASQKWESSSFQHLKDISEEDRDKCVAELTGATSKSNKKCSVSASCLRLMLSYGRHGYSLQQQIIYVAFVEKVGCSSTIDDFLRSEGGVGTTVDRVQQMFCSNAYYELSKNIFLYGLQPSFRDLFIQAQFTCPNLGFFEFLQHDWLNLILSWQKESGCYTLGVEQPIQEKEQQHANKPEYIGSVANSNQHTHNKGVPLDEIGLVRHIPLNVIGVHQQTVADQKYVDGSQVVIRNNDRHQMQVANNNYILHQPQVANFENVPHQLVNHDYAMHQVEEVDHNNIPHHPQIANLGKVPYQHQGMNKYSVKKPNLAHHEFIPNQPQGANLEVIPDMFQGHSHDYTLHQLHASNQDVPLGVPQIHYRHSNYIDSGKSQPSNIVGSHQHQFFGNSLDQLNAHHQHVQNALKNPIVNDPQQRGLFHNIPYESSVDNFKSSDVTVQSQPHMLNNEAISLVTKSVVNENSGGSVGMSKLKIPASHAERRSINLNRNEFANPWQRFGKHTVMGEQLQLQKSGHNHALLPVAAKEIAHGIQVSMNDESERDSGNSVREYIHGGVDQIPAGILQDQQQENFQLHQGKLLRADLIPSDIRLGEYGDNPHQVQFARDSHQPSHFRSEQSANQWSQALHQPWVQRSLLWSSEVDRGQDDDGYTFNRDKHIGEDSESNATKSYLYYYPMFDQMKQMSQMKYNRAEMMKGRQRPSARKLLREKTDKGSCHDYMTGLATSALAMYIRFMVDPGPVEFHHLRLNKPDGNYDVGLENAAIDDDEPEEPHVGYHGINFAGNSGAVITPRRVAASAPGVNNMQHSNDKGSYKPNMSFKPLYLGEVRKKLHPEESEDYVHTADTYKELVDRAFIQSSHEGMQLIMPSENSLHVKADLNVQRIDKKISTLEFPDVEYIGNTPSRTKSVVDSIQLSNFQLHLQKELGYHMVIIVAISLLCVFVLFKYLRHKKFSSRHRTKFV